MTRANVQLVANVMIAQADRRKEAEYIPGDLAWQVYRQVWGSVYLMTERQQVEYRQYLVCLLCRKPCAGTCA
jgi:hypothetical protein